MYTVEFCSSSNIDFGIVSYQAVGSLDQIIEGARVKSMQHSNLRYKEWSVQIYQNGEFVCSRTIKNGNII